MSADRFIWRWSLRLLRKEWRRHAAIFTLILTGVALSVGGGVAAYNLVEPPESSFGLGRFAATTSRPDQLERLLDDEEIPFGTVQSGSVLRKATTERLTLRALDPDNPVTRPLITLLTGDWPSNPGEIAITDRALLNQPAIGSTIQLDGGSPRVVGFVENPTSLSDEFALVADVAAVAGDEQPVTMKFLVDADPSDVDLSALSDVGIESLGGPPARTAFTMIVNVVGALGMLEISLLIGAAFAVIARRRRRQYGLLAAAGAGPKLLRRSATVTGVVLGGVSSVLGAALGVGVARLIVPNLETSVGHRIDFAVPLWTVVPNAALALFVAGMAARWPTRTLSERPVVDLLGSLRPRPEPVGRSATTGVLLTGAGAAALIAGFARLNLWLALLGTVLAPIGLLLLAPFVVRTAGWVATRLPLSERLGGRAVARYNRRSAAVTAALALALSIPVALSVVTTSVDERAESRGPNLAENWMIAWAPGANDRLPRLPLGVDAGEDRTGLETLAGSELALDLIPVRMAVPNESPVEPRDFPTIGEVPSVAPVLAGRTAGDECVFCNSDSYSFGERDPSGNEISYVAEPSWVASPPLLSALGLDSGWLGSATLVLAKRDGLVAMQPGGVLTGPDQVEVSTTWPRNSAIPPLMLSPDLVDPLEYDIVTVGWLGVSDAPITPDTQQSLRDAGHGLRLEFHEPPEVRSGLRAAALTIGLVVGLGIVTSAVALLSTEASRDIALLAAMGASPRTGRRLSAAMAGMLALGGAVLALLIGYLPLLPMLTARGDNFPFVVPWSALAALLITFPVVAATVGWLSNEGAAKATTLREFV